MNKADANLRDYAFRLIIDELLGKKQKISVKSFGAWKNIHADLFVTAYNRPNDTTSANVWCCYSNGDPEGINTVLDNLKGAVRSCLLLDTRHKPLDSPEIVPPAEVDLTILAPRKRWKHIIDIKSLKRERRRALYVKTLYGSAFYIPSVWDERLDWNSTDIIRSLAHKAGGNLDSITEIYEVPVYEIPTKSMENHETNNNRNRGFFKEILTTDTPITTKPVLSTDYQNENTNILHDVLEKIWYFYYNNSDNNRLAYKIMYDNIPEYDNEGAWVRTISDVITFDDLNTYLGKSSSTIQPYVQYLLDNKRKIPLDDPQTMAVWIEFMKHFNILDTENLIGNFKELMPGIYDSDLSFANPQIIIALADMGKRKKLIGFLKTINNQVEKAVKNYGAFAANWISQALEKCYEVFFDVETFDGKNFKRKIEELSYKDNLLQLILRKAALHGDSLTIRACAITGLEALYKIKPNPELFNFIGKAIYKLIGISSHSTIAKNQLSNGGFSYAFDNVDLVRTDVTSHVVDAILLYLEML